MYSIAKTKSTVPPSGHHTFLTVVVFLSWLSVFCLLEEGPSTVMVSVVVLGTSLQSRGFILMPVHETDSQKAGYPKFFRVSMPLDPPSSTLLAIVKLITIPPPAFCQGWICPCSLHTYIECTYLYACIHRCNLNMCDECAKCVLALIT